MRRPVLGLTLLVVALAYAWLGTQAADPGGAATLLVPGNPSESARWVVTQAWGAAMTGLGVAGLGLSLGRGSSMAIRALVGVATLSSILASRAFASVPGWTLLAVLASMCAALLFVPIRLGAASMSPLEGSIEGGVREG
ncbi:MAG TPA: hypothetical protein VGI39_14340 [Polyangiaceae bacterium]|jgi:hypothetical protein